MSVLQILSLEGLGLETPNVLGSETSSLDHGFDVVVFVCSSDLKS